MGKNPGTFPPPAESAALTAEELRYAFAASDLGAWKLDHTHRTFTPDEQMARLVALPLIRAGERCHDPTAWIHPDDVDTFVHCLKMTRSGKSFTCEHRLLRPDGEVVHVCSRGLKLPTADSNDVFVGTTQDITEQTKTATALRVASQQAQAANIAKSRFLATMSHEIRTPMNAILGYAQLLSRDTRLSSEQHHQLRTLQLAGSRLLALIDDVLDMAKVESGRLQLNLRNCDLHGMLRELARDFGRHANQKGLTLTLQVQPSVPTLVRSDEAKLRQVISNLLGNAVRFTTQGNIGIDVSSEVRDTQTLVRVAVSDTGEGISSSEQQHLFEPFVQGEGGLRKNEGTGLGLALSRRLAQLLGGSISVRSETAQGSTFSFTFPCSNMLVARAAETELCITRVETYWPPRKVLVVDDRESNRALLTTALESVGIPVCAAENGLDAIKAMELHAPCAVLMDLQMPGMSGEEAAMALRRTVSGRELTIIAVSATAPRFDYTATRAEAPFDAFLPKPVVLEALFQALEQHAHIPFAREEAPKPSTSDQGRPAAREALRGLSNAERATFRATLEALDYDRLSEFVSSHPTLGPVAKLGLQELVENFDYNGLQVLLGEA